MIWFQSMLLLIDNNITDGSDCDCNCDCDDNATDGSVFPSSFIYWLASFGNISYGYKEHSRCKSSYIALTASVYPSPTVTCPFMKLAME